MKSFIRKILCFIIPIMLVSIALDWTISSILKQSHENQGEHEVLNDIFNGNAGCDLAIYGNSRAAMHFDPTILQDSLQVTSYNFGINGHGFWLQYWRHHEFIKNNGEPKTIILNVDKSTLEKRIDLYQYHQFLPYLLWNKGVREYTSSYIGFKQLDYFIPLIRYSGEKGVFKMCKDIITKKDSVVFRVRGYKGTDQIWDERYNQIEKYEQNKVATVDSATHALFEKFISECKNSNIQLILVCTPEYIESQEYTTNRSEVMAIFSKMAKKYDLLYLDYSNNEMSYNKDYFYNPLHLNIVGATRFSSMLAHDLKHSKSVFKKKSTL